jgi:hypothetical protein
VSDEDENGSSFEARLRWIAQQLGRSVEDLDLERIARAAGVDTERAREFLDTAEQWLTGQADTLASEVAQRFSGLADAVDAVAHPEVTTPAPGEAPHPLDLPSPAQGLALSAIDSGRWTVEPGSHVLAADGEGPPPADALGLVGELRVRDWIDASGALTLVGRAALKRWAEPTPLG